MTRRNYCVISDHFAAHQLRSADIKYIFSEFMAPSVFQGKRKLLKIPKCKMYIQYSENFQGDSVFQGKRKLFKNAEW